VAEDGRQAINPQGDDRGEHVRATPCPELSSVRPALQALFACVIYRKRLHRPLGHIGRSTATTRAAVGARVATMLCIEAGLICVAPKSSEEWRIGIMTDLLRQRLRNAGFSVCMLVIALMSALPTLAAGLTWPAITEPPTSRYVPGKWVWAELFTENAQAAQQFYRKVFDWSFQSFPSERGPGYTLALVEGESIGGMIQREHRFQSERGSRWVGMISVPDVKAAARYASEHGGKVVAPPRLLPGRGEVALLADPEGAPFGVIHSVAGDPPDYLAEDKQWVWIELWARDPKAMAQFYSGLAGYEIDPVDRPDGSVGYFLASGGYTRCAIIPSPAPAFAPTWLPYLRVEEVKAAVARAEQAGARIVVPPSPGIRGGRVALIFDSTGAPLGLAQLAQPEAE